MPKRKGKGVAVMLTFRPEHIPVVEEWACLQRLDRAVAIRQLVLTVAERALAERAENVKTAAAVATG